VAADVAGAPPAPDDSAGRGKIGAALRDRRVWALAAILFCMTSGSNALNFFLPSIVETFQKTLNAPTAPIITGLIVAVPYAFAAAAMVLWSRHSDRHLERRWHTSGAAALAGISIIVALLLDNPVAVIIGFIVLASGIYSAQIVFWSTPATILTGAGAAAGIGLINSVANLSGFVGPYFTGAMFKATGSYTPPFLIIGGLVLLGALGFAMLGRRLPDVPVAETDRSSVRHDEPQPDPAV
jgi:ACS family tartrate transporter-like MFS transporter